MIDNELLCVDESPQEALSAGKRRFGLSQILRAALLNVAHRQPKSGTQKVRLAPMVVVVWGAVVIIMMI